MIKDEYVKKMLQTYYVIKPYKPKLPPFNIEQSMAAVARYIAEHEYEPIPHTYAEMLEAIQRRHVEQIIAFNVERKIFSHNLLTSAKNERIVLTIERNKTPSGEVALSPSLSSNLLTHHTTYERNVSL